jgi:hypothetical protein
MIKDGRHPLAELVVPPDSPFIPNDTHMEATAGRVHVITGKWFRQADLQAVLVGIQQASTASMQIVSPAGFDTCGKHDDHKYTVHLQAPMHLVKAAMQSRWHSLPTWHILGR